MGIVAAVTEVPAAAIAGSLLSLRLLGNRTLLAVCAAKLSLPILLLMVLFGLRLKTATDAFVERLETREESILYEATVASLIKERLELGLGQQLDRGGTL